MGVEMATFGELIVKLRVDIGLSLRDAAATIELDAQHLARIELGIEVPPQPAVVRRMAELYRHHPETLLNLAGRCEVDSGLRDIVDIPMDGTRILVFYQSGGRLLPACVSLGERVDLESLGIVGWLPYCP